LPVPPRTLGLVALGGALGTLARYWVGVVTHARPGSFPWPTFLINVTGSLALGFVVARLGHVRWARPLLGIGFLGGFTTFSTFAVETDLLVADGHVVVAVLYVATSVAGGVAAARLAMRPRP
jgi:CrcB protein